MFREKTFMFLLFIFIIIIELTSTNPHTDSAENDDITYMSVSPRGAPVHPGNLTFPPMIMQPRKQTPNQQQLTTKVQLFHPGVTNQVGETIHTFALPTGNPIVSTFNWNGSTQSYVIPTNVPPQTAMTIDIMGAQGGGGPNGGLGGRVSVIVPVNPGQIFYVSVGRQGTGSTPGVTASPTSMTTSCPACYGGGLGTDGAFSGGGATSVRSPESSLTVIAGGGGGAGTTINCLFGGSGGGSVGGSPPDCPAGAATGGTQSNGGTGLSQGSRTMGGTAGSRGGAGGAGYFGGGSGTNGGGGGGDPPM